MAGRTLHSEPIKMVYTNSSVIREGGHTYFLEKRMIEESFGFMRACFFRIFEEKIIISRNWKKSNEFVQEVNRFISVFQVNNNMRTRGKSPRCWIEPPKIEVTIQIL